MIPALGIFAALKMRFLCPSFAGEENAKKRTMMKLVYQRKTFWMLAIGYGFFIFFVGGLAFWGPSMLQEMYGVSKESAGMTFGLVTIATGITGTIVGGRLVDVFVNRHMRKDEEKEMSPDSLRCYLGTKISACLTLAALPFLYLAPYMKTTNGFVGVIAPGLLLLFTNTAPCNIAIMNSVPEAARGQAMGLSVTVSHILGDIPSPAIIGLLRDLWDDKTVGNVKTILIANSFVSLAGLVWLVGVRLAFREGLRFFSRPVEV
jgi:sugar phosphate permease